MSWYRFSFTNDDVVSGKSAKAHDDFAVVCRSHSWPKKLALFSRWDDRRQNLSYFVHVPTQFELILEPYLSHYSAIVTSKPLEEGTRFEIGNGEDKELITDSK